MNAVHLGDPHRWRGGEDGEAGGGGAVVLLAVQREVAREGEDGAARRRCSEMAASLASLFLFCPQTQCKKRAVGAAPGWGPPSVPSEGCREGSGRTPENVPF